MRIGIGISEDLPVGVQQRLAAAVEGAGFSSLWTNEARGRDALLLCLAWAQVTASIDLGVGVVPLWTRSPAQLAMGAATLQEASGGRFLLGIGVSHPATMEPWHGARFERPLTAARELIEILDALESGRETDVDGTVLRSQRFALAISPTPPPSRRYLAAMGPRMLELAGTRADGVLLNWSDPDEIARAGRIVRDAAGARDVEVAAYVRVAVDGDRDVARAALAEQIGAYGRLDAYRAHFDRQGHGAAIERAREARRERVSLVDALGRGPLEALGWAGTPDDDPTPFVDRLREAGLDHLVLRVVVTGEDPVANVDAVTRCFATSVPDDGAS